jgi:hypothetical protein
VGRALGIFACQPMEPLLLLLLLATLLLQLVGRCSFSVCGGAAAGDDLLLHVWLDSTLTQLQQPPK